jgi:outer membrane protein TolC
MPSFQHDPERGLSRSVTPQARNAPSSAATLSRALIACLWLGGGSAVLGGCATYRPAPLPTAVELSHDVAQLKGAPADARTLDLPTIERLVLLNHPDLRAARAQHDAAQAQMLQAGLLPNPAVNGSIGYLMSGVGDATAWTAGISEDIRALITLSPRRQAAKAAAAQVDASLLWQEWQTLGKTRLLVVDVVEGERLRDLQQHTLARLDERDRQLRQSIADGNTDLATASPDFVAAADARTAVDDLQRRLLGQRHELAALLGLAPDASIALPATLELPATDDARIRVAAQDIERRRPDLVALQLGYQSQEATLRGAVLAQFPMFSLGYAASQDNSRVRNGGPAVTFDLPIFDRNQGNIAIAKATRQQLRDEYTARLSSAHGDIDALLTEQAQARAQLAALLPALRAAAHDAEQATSAQQQGLIDLRTYVDLLLAAQNQQAAAIALQQTVLEQQVALDTLLGAGMPDSLPKDVIAP